MLSKISSERALAVSNSLYNSQTESRMNAIRLVNAVNRHRISNKEPQSETRVVRKSQKAPEKATGIFREIQDEDG